MAVTPRKIIQGTQLPNAAAATPGLYACPANEKVLIKKLTFTNDDASTRTVTIHLVASGGTAAASNLLTKAVSIPAGGTYEAFDRDEDVLGCFLLALDTTWYFGNVYNAANGARRVNEDRQKRFFENLDVRYGLVFPPARKDGPLPMLGVGASF